MKYTKKNQQNQQALNSYATAILTGTGSYTLWNSFNNAYEDVAEQNIDEAIEVWKGLAIRNQESSTSEWCKREFWGRFNPVRKRKDYDGLIKVYEQAINEGWGPSFLWETLAGVYQSKGGDDLLITKFNEWAQTDKISHFSVWKDLGDAYGRRASYSDSINAYLRGLDLNPDNWFLWCELRDAYIKEGNYEGLLKSYERAVVGDRARKVVSCHLENTCKARGDYEGLIGVYMRAIRLVPDRSELWSDLGEAFKAAGRFDEAIAAFETALAKNPARYWIRDLVESTHRAKLAKEGCTIEEEPLK